MEFGTNSYDISSATTQQQLQSDPSVDTRELRQADTLAKQVHKQSNQVLMCATKKRPPLPKSLWFQVKRRVPTIFLVGQSKW